MAVGGYIRGMWRQPSGRRRLDHLRRRRPRRSRLRGFRVREYRPKRTAPTPSSTTGREGRSGRATRRTATRGRSTRCRRTSARTRPPPTTSRARESPRAEPPMSVPTRNSRRLADTAATDDAAARLPDRGRGPRRRPGSPPARRARGDARPTVARAMSRARRIVAGPRRARLRGPRARRRRLRRAQLDARRRVRRRRRRLARSRPGNARVEARRARRSSASTSSGSRSGGTASPRSGRTTLATPTIRRTRGRTSIVSSADFAGTGSTRSSRSSGRRDGRTAAARANWAPSSGKAFANFAYAAASRYPWVTRWTIWNEPNRTTFLRPTTAATYVDKLLNPAYAQLHAAIAGVQVAGGVTAPRAGSAAASHRSRGSARWRAAGAKLDAYAHHPYPGQTAVGDAVGAEVRELPDDHDGRPRAARARGRTSLRAQADLADRVRVPDESARRLPRRLAGAAGHLRRERSDARVSLVVRRRC